MSAHSRRHFRKAAVLGAGVMGAQIAAHLVNAGVETFLFELPAEGNNPNANVDKAIGRLKKLKPAPLAEPAVADQIHACNYDQHLEKLSECDLVIEAIAERMDWKKDLYDKIQPHLGANTVLATNTSGLSIASLSDVLDASIRARFCGVHFFNPPRYMYLAEVIPGPNTDTKILEDLEGFLTTTLGKGVVYAKDTPNFIGNRIGVFSMLATLHHTEAFDLGFDTVDALTGPAIGRAKSATYRTADVVGLDTFSHVVGTMADTLPNDPWVKHFQIPAWMKSLVEKGALGQKTGAGVFRKQGKEIQVLDVKQQDYRTSAAEVPDSVQALLKERDPAKQLAGLRNSKEPTAQFLWSIFRDLFHYSAVHLEDIADNARDLDLAVRWGYGWKLGPFESWQAAGWKQVAAWIQEDIEAGKALSDAPLPAWVFELEGVHAPEGAYSPSAKQLRPRSDLAVYKRQRFPEPLVGENLTPATKAGETVFETDYVRAWHQGDDVLIVSFKSKMNAVGFGVLDGLEKAIEEAEKHFQGLVIWQPGPHFSAGADLKAALEALKTEKFDEFEQLVERFQRVNVRLQTAMVPTVAAVKGLALGGGCEIVMHSAATVAALESYIGLVEIGVGLLPAGGGLKELALRAFRKAEGGDQFPHIQKAFQKVAMAEVSSSAVEAQNMGLLRKEDTIIFNANELLHVAIHKAKAMAEAGYRPPLANPVIKAGGDVAIATLEMMLANMGEGHFISEHDYMIGKRIATVLAGGEVTRGTPVDEDWLLALERKHFVALGKTEKTQERIEHMLKTGKAKRN
jgi:3-hydroxyacyl-CoA dehydrogenase